MEEAIISAEIEEVEEALPEDASDTDSPEETLGLAEENDAPEATNYEQVAKDDMIALLSEFPELRGKTSITELDNPLRYAALRDMGLSAREAYLATSRVARRYDNRSHIVSAVPHAVRSAECDMNMTDLKSAREIFSDLSDSQIQKLYKKVTR